MSSSIVDTGIARIKTIVTDKDSDIKLAVETFLSNKKNTKKIIGLETERVQKARKQFKTVLLQLCDGDHCLIVKLPCEESVNLPVSLFNFLNLPQFTFVGFDIKKTLVKLESEWGLTCKNSVEINPTTWNLPDMTNVGRRMMHTCVFSQRPTSPIFEEWDQCVLTKDQIKLATSNAYFAFGIGGVMLGRFEDFFFSSFFFFFFLLLFSLLIKEGLLDH
ncbi:uncharacterized protein LOC9314517 [Arabidopsis lyrata subsp. lyrata]|uniref:uncharacterized protein LOC9314517 n=1 Tax=Arabidopsis lyrata subsp. lyrata TaxID=81972 RepID=UPI000A29A872|nr:uncharacterized protein LOC9314517 [Arabidopsis lyrata subsp. lyrata]|eukprot:XP_020881920.1 uncharacterized protein LOC9314517 [Arabidopsis lyrata subsp. lyrata]